MESINRKNVRQQFEDLLHTTMCDFGFNRIEISPYKIRYVLNDLFVYFEGKYFSTLSLIYKGQRYEFNSIPDLFNNSIMVSKIRKEKLKKIFI